MYYSWFRHPCAIIGLRLVLGLKSGIRVGVRVMVGVRVGVRVMIRARVVVRNRARSPTLYISILKRICLSSFARHSLLSHVTLFFRTSISSEEIYYNFFIHD